MAEFGTYGDVHVDLGDGYVATVEIRRGPNNFFDITLIQSLCEAFEALDADLEIHVERDEGFELVKPQHIAAAG